MISEGRYTPQWEPAPAQPPAIGRLSEIRVPTLIIVGEHEQPDLLEVADLLVAEIAGSRKVIMKGTAHVPMWERPEEFNRVVLDFFQAAKSS